MSVLLTIGDFSRMTHLSIKALRHYHDVGLLEPAEIDRDSGYRRYEAAQVPVAQVIRRFRDLGMPVDEVRAVLDAPDVETRNRVIVAHLERMEEQLAQTQATVASLRTVLDAPRAALPVEFRSVGATPALVVRQVVTAADIEQWWFDAFRDLRKALDESGERRAGPDGCLYPGEMFEFEEGEMVAYVPVSGRPELSGRVQFELLPPVELAVTVHEGGYGDLDRTYGSLGTVVNERAVGVEGPIREHYLVGPFESDSEPEWRTEVCWPVFRTAG
jgi:DNA-binding transcriptional MerR regulator